MKLLNFLVILLIALFALQTMPLQAADTTSTDISWKEGDTWILYYGTATFGAAAGTDNVTTPAMDISDCNLEYGGIQVYCTDGTGTEDVNGLIMYSNDPDADLTYFSSNTYAGLDQIQVTTKEDTLGINAGSDDQFKRSKWMVLKFDGQTGNPNATVVNWFVFIHKKPGARRSGLAGSKATS